MKSAWPGKLEDGPFGWRPVLEEANEKIIVYLVL
jgi:hypothetical protein